MELTVFVWIFAMLASAEVSERNLASELKK